MRPARSTGLALAWAAASLLPRAAAAQGDPCAQRIHDGVALRRAGRDAEALEVFTAGLAACPTARMRVQVAWAEQALGRWLAAASHLREALAASDPWVAERRARLEGDLRAIEQHLGRVEVLGGVAGAAVSFDGVPAGALPLRGPVELVAGGARMEVRMEGYYPVTRDVTVAAGTVAREHVEMRPVAVEAQRQTPASAPARTEVAAPPPPPPPPTPPPLDAPSRAVDDPGATRRALAWTLAATSAVAFAVSGVSWALRESSASAFNAHGGGVCTEHEGVAWGGAECEALQRDAVLYRNLGVATLAAGAALAGASAVMFLTLPQRAGRAGLRCGVGLASATCALRF